MIYRRLIIFISLFSLLAAGCGYTTRSVIADRFHTVYVNPVINKIDITDESYSANRYRTYSAFIETEITQALIDKFLSDGNLRPTSEDAADLVLKGELVEFRKDPLRYDKNDDVIEYRLNLVLNLTLLDRRQSKVLWTENHFTGTTTYFTSDSAVKTDDQAINEALADLARRVVERTIEDW